MKILKKQLEKKVKQPTPTPHGKKKYRVRKQEEQESTMLIRDFKKHGN